jgi:hypothetical protein
MMKKNYDEEFAGVELGQTARDIVTGFKGTVTGFCLYMTGCAQVCIVPQVNDKGETVDGKWFDITRVEVDETTPALQPLLRSADDTRKGAPSGGGEVPAAR